MTKPSKLSSEYWNQFEVLETDFEYIYNNLLEIETPQSSIQLIKKIIEARIHNILDQENRGKSPEALTYLPKENYSIGENLLFPQLDWISGTVKKVRTGYNPEVAEFSVIDILLENGQEKSFASNLKDHSLNNPENKFDCDPLMDPESVITNFGTILIKNLEESLEKNDDLVRIAGNWFPKSLLIDINTGHINLIEAVLEESEGGPLSTHQLIDQIDLNVDTNSQLIEFSLNYALQADSRFDEVGPAGEVYWYLKRMEPEEVVNPPIYLQYKDIPYDKSNISTFIHQFEGDLFDELEDWEKSNQETSTLKVSLIYPHWRAGTLPLSYSLSQFFPTAYESPRVRFTFIDEVTGTHFPGWVVRPFKYVCGLRDWYKSHGLIPGSMVELKRGEAPGEIIVTSEKCRQSREWMRTALLGVDNGIVFGMLKQNIKTTFNERMSVFISNEEGLDNIWENNLNNHEHMNHVIYRVLKELVKLNPQIHAQELYACVNIVRRCPPGLILSFLLNNDEIKHLGDLYFQILEK